MIKYQYTFDELFGYSHKDIQVVLNKRGLDGWEVISMEKFTNQYGRIGVIVWYKESFK
jgi:5-hydroxyisourate hydrolase-like protein (transthyretin family)